jgi:hypothetical protein
MSYDTCISIEAFNGMTFTGIKQYDDHVVFISDTGDAYKMCHQQDCCEEVTLEDVAGDLEDLLNTPILVAEESSNESRAYAEIQLLTPEEAVMSKLAYTPVDSDLHESQTWTFYKFRTIKGSVTMRWFGSSNGYYSERVDIIKIPAVRLNTYHH